MPKQQKMPIYVHVKHYLNNAGMKRIDDWYKRDYDGMSKQDGFVSFTCEKFSDKGIVHFVVAFENDEKLEAWIKNPFHDEMIDELDQYRSVNYWEAARTNDPTADWQELDYKKFIITDK